MPVVSAQLTAPMVSGNPADAITNTLWFNSATEGDAVTDTITPLKALWNQMTFSWSNLVAQNGHTIKLTNIDDPQPRYPFYEETWNLSSVPTGAPAPTEVSICASFQGDRVSGTAQARRRGRIYVGPLKASLIGTDGRPTSGALSQISAQTEDFYDDCLAMAESDWGVYSRVGAIFTPITNGWVDNEFDTQRRRGRVATSRLIWP